MKSLPAHLGEDGRIAREELIRFIRGRQEDLAESAMSNKLEDSERQLLIYDKSSDGYIFL